MRPRKIGILLLTGLALATAQAAMAQDQAIHVTSTGKIGFGTDTPTTAVEVYRDDGKARILVYENSSTSASRKLFVLKNNGPTNFFINNTDAGVIWTFVNKGTGFRISKQGSGEVEFEVENNGDVNIAGVLTENSDVHAKQDIESVDGRNILEKLSQLEISEWSYKDAPKDRHIGPMAQDFRAAFGLGHTDKGISTLDSSGVALAAIQALADQNRQLADQNQQLNVKNRSLEQRVSELESQSQRVDELEVMVLRLAMSQAETTLVAN